MGFFQHRHPELTLAEKIWQLNWSLVLLITSTASIGFVMLYSAANGSIEPWAYRQMIRFAIGLVVMLLVAVSSIHFWLRYAYVVYLACLGLLIVVEFFGATGMGAKRWIDLGFMSLQPSELMKISLIVFLARYYNKIPSQNVNSIKHIFIPFISFMIPVYLVVKQPDLGTAVLIAISGLIVIWLTGFRLKYFLYSFFVLICLIPVGISFLKPYQKSRILTFLNPERDPLGAGYQIIQSKIAVGSGGIFGKGFLQGSQSYLDYLPEKHTDFIFTLFSEEFGFIGSLFLLIIYALIIYRISKIGSQTRNNFARLFCFGFAAAFFVYVTVNMSMVLGLLPIVGAPLPIMSYGGSSMLAIMTGLGIVMSCKIHRQEEIL